MKCRRHVEIIFLCRFPFLQAGDGIKKKVKKAKKARTSKSSGSGSSKKRGMVKEEAPIVGESKLPFNFSFYVSDSSFSVSCVEVLRVINCGLV